LENLDKKLEGAKNFIEMKNLVANFKNFEKGKKVVAENKDLKTEPKKECDKKQNYKMSKVSLVFKNHQHLGNDRQRAPF